MKHIAFARSLLLILLTALPLLGHANHQTQSIARPEPGDCEDAMRNTEDDGPELAIADYAAIVSNPVFIEIEHAVNAHETSNVVSLLRSPKSRDLVHNPSFVLLTARLLTRIGMHSDTQKLADVALRDFPNDRRLKYLKLKSLFKRKIYEGALEYARRNPDMDEIWERQWILSSYIRLKRLNEARAFVDELLADPKFKQASNRLKEHIIGLAFRMPADPSDPTFKIKVLNFGIANTESPDFWGIRLAHLLSRFNRHAEAMAVLDKVIAQHPPEDSWWNQSDYYAKKRTVLILMENGRYDEALDFNELIKSPTDHALLQAQIFNLKKDYQQVVILSTGQNQIPPMMWERAMAFHKLYNDQEAYKVLTELLYKTARSPNAAEHIYRVVAFMLKIEKEDGAIPRASVVNDVLDTMSNSELDRVRSEQKRLEAN